jgi:hypothetical protein
MKTKKIKFSLLIAGTLFVWGNILYYLYYNITTPSKTIGKNTLLIQCDSVSHRVNFESVKSLIIKRDPFGFALLKEPIQKKESPIKIPKKEFSFDYRINGVIVNMNDKLVLVEDQVTHQIYFMREGDNFNFLTILKIKKNLIEVLEENTLKHISL